MMRETVYTPAEAAEILGFNPQRIYRLVKTREIGCYRSGTGRDSIQIPESEIVAYRERIRIPSKYEINSVS